MIRCMHTGTPLLTPRKATAIGSLSSYCTSIAFHFTDRSSRSIPISTRSRESSEQNKHNSDDPNPYVYHRKQFAKSLQAKSMDRSQFDLFGSVPSLNILYMQNNLTTKSKSSGNLSGAPEQRRHIDTALQQVDIRTASELYRGSQKIFTEIAPNAWAILMQYRNSYATCIQTLYPEYDWTPWMFQRVPVTFWDDPITCRQYLDWAKTQLGMVNDEDWYDLEFRAFWTLPAGASLLIAYNNSFSNMVESLYPERFWMKWKYTKVSRGYWNSTENVRYFIHWFEQHIGLRELDEWYDVPTDLFFIAGGSHLWTKYGGLYPLLKHIYPNHNWNPKEFKRNHRGRNQATLYRFVKRLFEDILPAGKDLDVFQNFIHQGMDYGWKEGSPKDDKKLKKGTSKMELDIYIPSLQLAFEYQGEYHYTTTNLYGEDVHVKTKEEAKRQACESAGITLIEIPYWWGCSYDNLKATVHKYRPDLIPDPGPGKPIPSDQPSKRVSLAKKAKKRTVTQET